MTPITVVVKVRKVGDTVVLTVPKVILRSFRIKPGDYVYMSVRPPRLSIWKARV